MHIQLWRKLFTTFDRDKLIENNDTTTKFDDPQTELQSIINQLEKQNEQLQAELAGINDTKAEKIENYRSAIEMQLARLKEFKVVIFQLKYSSANVCFHFFINAKNLFMTFQNCLFTQSDPIVDLNLVQSTPMIRPISSRVRPLPLAFELSPIICHDTAECDNSQVNSHIYNSREDEGLATSREITSASNVNVESSEINLSTWLGGTIFFHSTRYYYLHFFKKQDYFCCKIKYLKCYDCEF